MRSLMDQYVLKLSNDPVGYSDLQGVSWPRKCKKNNGGCVFHADGGDFGAEGEGTQEAQMLRGRRATTSHFLEVIIGTPEAPQRPPMQFHHQYRALPPPRSGLVDLGCPSVATDPLPTHDTRAVPPPLEGADPQAIQFDPGQDLWAASSITSILTACATYDTLHSVPRGI
ncbi:hypothetical protein CK203_060347 [Vitis vinifera]|uniref:Uncharacterized protein n=1 Tax=Vitis vinifera TaxID=29760 RepID=A0A438FRY7_VITVI|nr:hypothetical protein CK203_060347 [Vitis vinifera]